MVIQVGDIIPEGTFRYVPYTPALADRLACGSPIDYKTSEWKGKKVVIVSVVGAFTPTCHRDHLPSFLQKYEEFRAKGVDLIVVLAVNDPWVMSGWARVEGLDDKIIAASDVDAKWSASLGLSKDHTATGFGIRTMRYALMIEDPVVKYVGVETESGVNVSSADAVLAKL